MVLRIGYSQLSHYFMSCRLQNVLNKCMGCLRGCKLFLNSTTWQLSRVNQRTSKRIFLGAKDKYSLECTRSSCKCSRCLKWRNWKLLASLQLALRSQYYYPSHKGRALIQGNFTRKLVIMLQWNSCSNIPRSIARNSTVELQILELRRRANVTTSWFVAKLFLD